MTENISREEFEHFIAEFEGFRDSMLDELTALTEKIEILNERLSEAEQSLSRAAIAPGKQSRLG